MIFLSHLGTKPCFRIVQEAFFQPDRKYDFFSYIADPSLNFTRSSDSEAAFETSLFQKITAQETQKPWTHETGLMLVWILAMVFRKFTSHFRMLVFGSL